MRVRRIAAVDDAGRIVNPLLAEGQVIGGAVHGLGAAMTEEMIHNEDGQPVVASLLDYGLSTAADVPELRTRSWSRRRRATRWARRASARAAPIGTPAAIGNAIAARSAASASIRRTRPRRCGER